CSPGGYSAIVASNSASRLSGAGDRGDGYQPVIVVRQAARLRLAQPAGFASRIPRGIILQAVLGSFPAMNAPALFLSYNSADRQSVVAFQKLLQGRGITTFLDRDDLVAGLAWP